MSQRHDAPNPRKTPPAAAAAARAAPPGLDPKHGARCLQAAAAARALVLVVLARADEHADAGQRFVADVLHANGLATLPLALGGSDGSSGRRPPGLVSSRRRVGAWFAWLGAQPALAETPLALLACGEAVAGIAAGVARNPLPLGLRTLVLLDGRPDRVAHHLARVRLPTLIVAGGCDGRAAQRCRDAVRAMSAPHRLHLLAQRTGAQPAAGAHQAFVHEALGWFFDRTLPQRRQRALMD